MENKVLIKLMFPELETSYDVYIPVNEIIWKIKILLSRCISDLSDIKLNAEEYMMFNSETGKMYGNNEIVLNTDIRNGSEIILISKEG